MTLPTTLWSADGSRLPRDPIPGTVYPAIVADDAAADCSNATGGGGGGGGGGGLPVLAELIGFDYDVGNAVHEHYETIYTQSGAYAGEAVLSIPNTADIGSNIGAELLGFAPGYCTFHAARPEINGHAAARVVGGAAPYEANLVGINLPGLTMIAVARPFYSAGNVTTGGEGPAMFAQLAAGGGFDYKIGMGAYSSGVIGGFRPGPTMGEVGEGLSAFSGYAVKSGVLFNGTSANPGGLPTIDTYETLSPYTIFAARIDATTGLFQLFKNGYLAPNSFHGSLGPYAIDKLKMMEFMGGVFNSWDWTRLIGWGRAITDAELTATFRVLGTRYNLVVA